MTWKNKQLKTMDMEELAEAHMAFAKEVFRKQGRFPGMLIIKDFNGIFNVIERRMPQVPPGHFMDICKLALKMISHTLYVWVLEEENGIAVYCVSPHKTYGLFSEKAGRKKLKKPKEVAVDKQYVVPFQEDLAR